MPGGDCVGGLEGVRVSFICNLFELSGPDRCPIVSEDLQAMIQRAVQDGVINVDPSLGFIKGRNG
jgi:hypothetical protein